MPTIITMPVRTRTNTRGVSEDTVQEYLEAMQEAGAEQLVLVDDVAEATYDKAYVKAERIRTAARKFNLEETPIQVIAFKSDEQDDDGNDVWIAGLRFKA